MYLYRVLSDTDISIMPQKNGIFSKRIIFDKLFDYFCFISYASNFTIDIELLKELAKDSKSCFNPYLISELISEAKNENNRVKNLFKFESIEEVYVKAPYIGKVTSSITNHLRNGSRLDTNWISFSSDLDSIIRYYKYQSTHQIAVIDSNIDFVFDGDLLALNLSTRDLINNNGLLVKTNDYDHKVDIFCPAYNNAINSKEYLYYNYIPKEKILYVMKSLFIDMYYNEMIDKNVLKDNKAFSLEMMLYKLISIIIKRYNDYYKSIIIDLYYNNKSIDDIILNNNITKEELLILKEEILNELSNMDYAYKRKLTHKISFMD